ncbi:MAG TPA: bifunctional methylenetetrahydrofolate dehydrogenase/methenyltetrahydrofolate cyclohydrolase, partial [Chromatiaceae bacterium]|nr:bifunctional methylenetetrahydrofolate dehydrogenase/methenyltetrahydrofolate cyclohydrolase [Chromatiaceae bacterium]
MSAQILDGKAIAADLRATIKDEVATLLAAGRRVP